MNGNDMQELAEALPEHHCAQCGAPATHTVEREDGQDYPIWTCQDNPYHWGTR